MTNPDLKISTWVMILALTSAALSYAFACVTPFSALATIAALTLTRKTGLLLILSTWVLNQLIGYTLLDYPYTMDSLLWGVVIGISALFAFFIADSVVRKASPGMAIPASFLASFAIYELVLLVASFLLGGSENFAPSIVVEVFAGNAIALAALLAANWLNSKTGTFPLPRARIFYA